MTAPLVQDLRVFLQVIDSGSFSAVARELNIGPATVSKQIARLEKALAIRLFERSTRLLHVTDEGRSIADRVRTALSLLDSVGEVANLADGELRGSIRLTAPSPFGRKYVAPALAAFRRLHPQVEFDLHLSDELVDLIDSRLDLAVRIGGLADSSLLARRLAPNRRLLVAAPDYLKRRGVPQRPADLSAHDCLVLANPGHLQNEWLLQGARGDETVFVGGGLRANSGGALREWAVGGAGIALKSTWDVANEIREGRLLAVLPDWRIRELSIYAVRPSGRYLPRRVEALIDFLAARFGDPPPWDRVLRGLV